MIDVIERIKKSVKEHSYPIIVGRNSHDVGMTVEGFMQVLDEELAKEPQECKWYKGINSVETCWGDIDIKTFNKFKRQGAKFCPYCGRKIKEV